MWGPPPGGWTPPPPTPAPYARKPSIVDRVAARLFPTAAYTGLLDPEQQQGLSRQGLLNLGTNLLQAGGASPNQRGTLANIGASIAGVNFPEMAQRALQLRAYQQQQAAEKRIGEVAAQNAPGKNETPEQTYERIARMVGQLAGTPGTEDLIGKLSNVLAQIRPREHRSRRVVRTGVDPKTGKAELYSIDLDTGEKTPLGLGAMQRVNEGQPTESERRAGALFTVGEDAYNQLKAAKSPSVSDFAAGQVPFGLGQAAVSGQQQLQNQAGMQLYRSYLYIVSGAAATDKEAEAAARTFTPQIGDDEGTIARKAKARDVMIRAMRQAAGRSIPKMVPVPDDEESDNFDDFLKP